MAKRAWIVLMLHSATALRVGIAPSVGASDAAAVVQAARDTVGRFERKPLTIAHPRCAYFEGLDDDALEAVVARLDELEVEPLLCLGGRWSSKRADAAVASFAERYGLREPVITAKTSWRPDAAVVAENWALDGAWEDFEGRRWYDNSRVAAVDGLVDERLRGQLLKMIRATPEAPDRRSWRRGALRDVVGDGAPSSSGACWGLTARRLAALCDPAKPPAALVELQSRIVKYLEAQNDGLVVSLLPEAALGDAVSPLAANAPTAGDVYGYHIDADPAQLPPGPFSDFFSRYPNRARGKPRFVSALVYLSPEWQDEWGAPARFLDPPTDKVIEVRPVPARVVFLDQDVTHTVVAPNAVCDRPRYSLVLKLVLHPASPDATARFAPDPPTLFGSARKNK